MDCLLGCSDLSVCARTGRASPPECGGPTRNDHARDEDDVRGEIAYRTRAGTGRCADTAFHTTRARPAEARKP